MPRVALVTAAMSCGGVETVLLQLGTALAAKGCDVSVVTTVQEGPWFGEISAAGLDALHIARERRSGFVHALNVGRRLRQGGFDAVFLNHAKYAQAALAVLPDRVLAVPVFHNDVENIYEIGCANASAWNVGVCVSPKVCSVVRSMVRHRPVVQILNGVQLSEPPSRAVRRSLISDRCLTLVYVGRLHHEQKGVLILPDILAKCLDRGVKARLTIIGTGPDDAALRESVTSKGLATSTEFLGPCENAAVRDHLRKAAVLLMPSFHEGLPIALLEGMAEGCVPVVTRLPGITDVVVEAGISGFLPEGGDADGFADAIAALYSDPALLERLSQNAYETVVRKFSVERMAEEYLKLISEGLAGRYPLSRSRRFQLPVDPRLLDWRDYFPAGIGKRSKKFLVGLKDRCVS